jgi:hypothetical protein
MHLALSRLRIIQNALFARSVFLCSFFVKADRCARSLLFFRHVLPVLPNDKTGKPFALTSFDEIDVIDEKVIIYSDFFFIEFE